MTWILLLLYQEVSAGAKFTLFRLLTWMLCDDLSWRGKILIDSWSKLFFLWFESCDRGLSILMRLILNSIIRLLWLLLFGGKLLQFEEFIILFPAGLFFSRMSTVAAVAEWSISNSPSYIFRWAVSSELKWFFSSWSKMSCLSRRALSAWTVFSLDFFTVYLRFSWLLDLIRFWWSSGKTGKLWSLNFSNCFVR